MKNKNLLISKYELNEFTENLTRLIRKSDRNTSFMVKTRSGDIIRTSDIRIMTDYADRTCFMLISDCYTSWYGDGSCSKSLKILSSDLSPLDLISSEEA
jgi:hypothetical protein